MVAILQVVKNRSLQSQLAYLRFPNIVISLLLLLTLQACKGSEPRIHLTFDNEILITDFYENQLIFNKKCEPLQKEVDEVLAPDLEDKYDEKTDTFISTEPFTDLVRNYSTSNQSKENLFLHSPSVVFYNRSKHQLLVLGTEDGEFLGKNKLGIYDYQKKKYLKKVTTDNAGEILKVNSDYVVHDRRSSIVVRDKNSLKVLHIFNTGVKQNSGTFAKTKDMFFVTQWPDIEPTFYILDLKNKKKTTISRSSVKSSYIIDSKTAAVVTKTNGLALTLIDTTTGKDICSKPFQF